MVGEGDLPGSDERRFLRPAARRPTWSGGETETAGGDQAAAREQAGHRVEPRDLERLLARQRGQDRGQPASDHGLAGTGRADHQHVVASPAAAISRARRAEAWPRTSERSTGAATSDRDRVDVRRRGRRLLPSAAQELDDRPAGSGAAIDVEALDEPLPRLVAPRDDQPSKPRAGAAMAIARIPGSETSSPRSDSSPANAVPTSAVARICAGGRQHAQRDGEVEPRSVLAEAGGRQVHDHARSGHSRPELSTAGRTRSRASWTPAPGRPGQR